MKSRVLIIIGIVFAFTLFSSLTIPTFASHTGGENHPTPFGPEEPPVPEPEQEIPTKTACGPGTTYQDGICVVDEIENTTNIPDPSKRWGAIPVENVCGAGTEYVNGLCKIIKFETRGSYVNTSPFFQSLLFMLLILPIFIPGAIIFVVLSKTPRFSREIRITVCIPAIIMILYFLSGFYIGWYPPGFA